MAKRLIDGLSIAAVLIVMVIIIYASSALIDGRFYEEDVYTSWEEITETFPRWEYSTSAQEQAVSGSVESSEEIREVVIGNVEGKVIVETWEHSYSSISFDRSAVRESYLDDVFVEILEQDGRFEAATHYRPNIPSAVGHVDYLVKVPEDTGTVRVNTITGEVDIRRAPDTADVQVSMVSSRVQVEGGSSLEVRGVNGSVDFLTHGGSISIQVYSSPVRGAFRQFRDDQDIDIRTDSGDIELLFPSGLEDIEYLIRTQEGQIALSPALARMSDETVEGEVQGVLGDPRHAVTLESREGDITLRLAGDEGQLKSIDLLESTEDLRLFDFIEDAFDFQQLDIPEEFE